jgi:hypothetical protein
LQLDAIARDERWVIVVKLGPEKHPVARRSLDTSAGTSRVASLRSANSVAAPSLEHRAHSRVMTYAAWLPSRVVRPALSHVHRPSSLSTAGLFMTIEVT